MSSSSVVIVADRDAEIATLTQLLAEDGYDLVGPTGPLQALRFCGADRPAAILVDVRLRDLSVGEFCALARGRSGSDDEEPLVAHCPRGQITARAVAGDRSLSRFHNLTVAPVIDGSEGDVDRHVVERN